MGALRPAGDAKAEHLFAAQELPTAELGPLYAKRQRAVQSVASMLVPPGATRRRQEASMLVPSDATRRREEGGQAEGGLACVRYQRGGQLQVERCARRGRVTSDE